MIFNLLLITGNYGRPGTGAHPLHGRSIVQGASDVGSMPARFPGCQFVSDKEVSRRFEEAWQADIPKENRLNNHKRAEAIHDGK